MNRRSTYQGRTKKIVIISITAFVIIILAVYLGFSFYFKNHFFFKTEINGLKVGGMTVEDAEQKLSDEVDEYLLTLYDRDDEKYYIKGADIGCKYISDNSVEKLLKEQNAFAWPKFIFKLQETEMSIPMEYDAALLETAVSKLALFQEENMVEPENAYIKQEGNDFEVVPEVMGNKAILEKVALAAEEAVAFGKTEAHLDDDSYENPEVTTDSSLISEAKGTIDRYLGTVVTYDIKEQEEVLDESKIKEFIVFHEDYSVTLDDAKIETYVQYLASKYNTYGDEREFKSSMGDTVVVGGGDYGWIVNKEKEAETIKENILAGDVLTRELEYLQRALVEGLDDIGDTYLEIDYTNQHMWYYEKGELIMESDVVTGNIARSWGSPDGVFKIVYKKSPDVLRGEDYESDVAFFMPFAYNVGVHDAGWRSSFGGSTYKTQGSHGCINAPYEAAEKLYQTIEVGTPVIAFYREPVELTAENTRIANAYSYVKPEKEE